MAEKTVKAPMPGTFLTAGPTRRATPTSEEGSNVSVGDTIGLVEVMKSFHEIKAEEAGTVSKFLVGEEEAVSAGQDLIELE